jgi:hypothetical protein
MQTSTVIVSGLALLFFILSVVFMVMYLTYKPTPVLVNPSNLPMCVDAVDKSTLFDVKTLEMCKGLPDTYYISEEKIKGSPFIVSKTKKDPFLVCKAVCNTLSGNVCVGDSYNGKSAQTLYDECKEYFSKKVCAGALPMAKKGDDLYYAMSAKPGDCLIELSTVAA